MSNKISPKTFKILLSLWCNKYYAKNTPWIIANSTSAIGDSKIYRYFGILRNLLSTYFKNFIPIIETEDEVFEIDEMFLGAKQRGKHGRKPTPYQTFFGNYTDFVIVQV